MREIIYSLMFLLSIVSITAQQTPANKQTESVSIEGATAHLGNGEVIENSLVMFSQVRLLLWGIQTQK